MLLSTRNGRGSTHCAPSQHTNETAKQIIVICLKNFSVTYKPIFQALVWRYWQAAFGSEPKFAKVAHLSDRRSCQLLFCLLCGDIFRKRCGDAAEATVAASATPPGVRGRRENHFGELHRNFDVEKQRKLTRIYSRFAGHESEPGERID